MPKKYLDQAYCQRCGQSWHPRLPGKPRRCPKCGSACWDVPKPQPAKASEKCEAGTDPQEVQHER